MANETTDEELVERYRGGDQLAFQTLYRRRARRLTWEARLFIGSREEALSVADDALLTALRKYDASRGVRFLTYTLVVLRRRCYDKLREAPAGLTGLPVDVDARVQAIARIRPLAISEHDLNQEVAVDADPADAVTQSVVSEDWIERVLSEMPIVIARGIEPARRRAVWADVLQRWDGQPGIKAEELAQAFGCSADTVWSDRRWLQEAVARIRRRASVDSAGNMSELAWRKRRAHRRKGGRE